jgi:hypothetical protein
MTHPRQASLVVNAFEIAERVASRSQQAAAGGPAYLWKYVDPENNTFYLEEKKTTIKSPYTGKTFTAKPTKHTLMQVGKEMKEEKAEEATTKEASVDIWK